MQRTSTSTLPTSLSSLLRTTALGLVLIAAPTAAHATAFWTGGTDTDWFDTANWDAGAIPLSSDYTEINSGTFQPNITSAGAVTNALRVGGQTDGTLNISAGGTVTSVYSRLGGKADSQTPTGTATVTGAGSLWTVSLDSYVGEYSTGTLNILNGADYTTTDTRLGLYSNATGSLTVDGTGSTYTGANELRIAEAGTGTLTISNGGVISNTVGYIGKETGSSGTATITGAGSTWTNASNLYVGNSGTGTLTISDGGAVTAVSTHIANNGGSTGTITLTGSGSSLVNSSNLVAGDSGNATLTISNGATATSVLGFVAANTGAVATATVTDAGSTWTNSGTLIVGNNATTDGTLIISNGGTVSNTNGFLGQGTGSVGRATITGAGSTWTNSINFLVGSYGNGTLTVSDGGTITAAGNSVISGHSVSTSTATVTDAGSTWTSVGNMAVGDLGNGTLSILDGGVVSNTNGYIGTAIGSVGAATVTGTSSTWTNTGALYVGSNGTGTLTIEDGGTVTNVGSTIGAGTNGAGILNLTGTGSTWTNTGRMHIGDWSTGTLNLTGGAKAYGIDARVGNSSTGVGIANISGAGSSMTLSADLRIAHGWNGAATGTMTISDGGTVSNTIGYIGDAATTNGTATVTGTGSRWTNTSILSVGRSGTGTLNVEDGGAVTNTAGYIGESTGSTGTATVSGAGSTWTNSGELDVGQSGTGTLTISAAASVSSTEGRIGTNASSNGTVTVTGDGSRWDNSTHLRVGRQGTGTLNIENGGVVTNTWAHIGSQASSTGTVTVTGTNSTWTNNSSLNIGSSGNGTLNVLNGGVVTNDTGYIGREVGSTGTATVTGTGSNWANNRVYIGYDGSGALTVENGGSVTSTEYNIFARNAGSTGTAIVTGANSSWTTNDYMTIGLYGDASLTIKDSATISATTVTIADQASSTGTLNIGAASGDTAVAAGVLDTPRVTFGAGTGTLLFNHTDTNYLFAPDVTGAGTITAEGGVTSMTGDMSGFTGTAGAVDGAVLNLGASFGGGLSVASGAVIAANDTVAGAVAVNNGGTLKGSGTVGATTVASGGIVAPGNSIGTITVSGNISFAAGSFLDNELNASGATDLTHATGTATLTGGTVRLLPELSSDNILIGNVYTILTADGGVGGTFTDVTLDSLFLTPSLSYDATNVYASAARNGTALVSAAITYDQAQVAAALDTASNAALSVAASQSSYANAQIAFSALEGGFHANVKRTVTQGDFAFVDLMSSADKPTYWSTYYGDAYAGGAFSADRQGIAFGRVVTVGDDAMAGLAAAVGHTDVEDQPEDTAKINHYRIGAHYAQSQGDFTFKGQAQYSYHSIGTKRLISIPGYKATHKADYDAHSLMGRAEVAYNARLGEQLYFQPYAAFAYGYSTLSDFSETGGAATLAADSDASTQGAVSFGVRMAQDMNIQGTPAKFRTSLGFEHKLGEETPTGAYRFNGSQEFISHGTRWAQSSLTFDAGLDLTLTDTMALNFKYGTIQGADSSSHSGRAGINWKF